MGQITFVLGGARSGKSGFAVQLAGRDNEAAFIATGLPSDSEMKDRISRHKKDRPKKWITYEASENLPEILEKIPVPKKSFCVIIDCLTLLVSGLMIRKYTEKRIIGIIERALETIRNRKIRVIIVSNEVGLGIVPKNRLAREFRDIAGRINCLVAEKADTVYFMAAGLAMKLK